uniref:ATP-binding protein n=1 Tax=Salicibibacter halophilus TaxID=2502791 RepID=UPI001D056E14|nr:ATP-binding protein [Salicibibacter halophilus]
MTIKTQEEWHADVQSYAKELKLPMIRRHVAEHASEASMQDISYEAFLAQLLQKEQDARRESARYNRIRRAEFNQKKYLEDLSVQDLPEDAQKKLNTLKSLDFIREGRNAIFAGNAGTGKSHMAIGLGMKACLEGFKVWFTTVPILVNQIKETPAVRSKFNHMPVIRERHFIFK